MNTKLLDYENTLPIPAKPLASYVPCSRIGEMVITSGALPLDDGQLLYTGQLKGETDVEKGQAAAQLCLKNLLASVKAELGSLSKIKKVIKIVVFVSSESSFILQHLVANGASNQIVEIFGSEVGSHARSAVGVASLPNNASVEIEAIFQI